MICIICTPLNAVSAGSTPGVSRQGKGKTKKYGANAPQLHPIWPQAATGAHAPAPLPLSIFDGEGEEVRPTTTATTLLAQPCGCSQQAGAGIAITLPPPEKRSRISEGRALAHGTCWSSRQHSLKALAPTDHPAACFSSGLSSMPSGHPSSSSSERRLAILA